MSCTPLPVLTPPPPPSPGAQIHARGKPLDADVDLEQVARDLPGLSGAELANVLNEAALEAVRRDALSITSADVYNAIDRILQVSFGLKPNSTNPKRGTVTRRTVTGRS